MKYTWFVVPLPFLLLACGDLLTELPDDSQSIDAPFDDLTPAQMRAHIAGDEAFGERFTVATGLGPVFNQTSCESCHPRDGRAHPFTNLIRFGRLLPDGRFDYMLDRGGPQLQDRAIPGYPAETLPAGITGRSERGGPLVAGIGLIEAIPDEVILALEDPDDADGDGVSGRAAFVTPPEWLPIPPGKVMRDSQFLGRFGRKAAAITLLQQVVEAYRNDMGITSDFLPEDPVNPVIGNTVGDNVADPEISRETIQNVVIYLQTLRPPPRRDVDDTVVQQGERLFVEIGCATCHVPELQTGPHPIAALSFKRVRLYSDLLLHDMGPELADHYPEGAATGSEWRTTPLWGLGLLRTATGGTPYYLHDGRTSDLREVIRLHGGEAARSRSAFFALPEDQQAAVLRFLQSL